MSDRNRNDKGRFAKEHSDAEVIASVRKHEPAATGEVADGLGIHHASAYRRLIELRDVGLVESKMLGRTLAWFVADD